MHRPAFDPDSPQFSNDDPTWVTVEGPGDGEATVMPIRDAIENELLYSWGE